MSMLRRVLSTPLRCWFCRASNRDRWLELTTWQGEEVWACDPCRESHANTEGAE